MKDLADTGNGFQFLHVFSGSSTGESVDDPGVAGGGNGPSP